MEDVGLASTHCWFSPRLFVARIPLCIAFNSQLYHVLIVAATLDVINHTSEHWSILLHRLLSDVRFIIVSYHLIVCRRLFIGMRRIQACVHCPAVVWICCGPATGRMSACSPSDYCHHTSRWSYIKCSFWPVTTSAKAEVMRSIGLFCLSFRLCLCRIAAKIVGWFRWNLVLWLGLSIGRPG